MDKVLLDWVGDLPYKVQSVLVSAQRGPDSHFCPKIKSLTKWVRRVCQVNADPSHSFMEVAPLPTLDDIEYELEYCTMHYVLHFSYGLEIISYKHPDEEVRKQAFYYYKGIVEELFHFNIENEEQFKSRLVDKISKS